MSVAPLRRPWRPSPASEAAAAWALLHEEGELSEADRRRFTDWLAQDPANAAAYEDAVWALDAVAHHAAAPEMLALRAAALEARGSNRRHWPLAGAIGAAAAAALFAIGLWSIPDRATLPAPEVAGRVAPSEEEPSYRTAVGERSVVTLPDGSIATLDTNSQIRVAYSSTARAVYLNSGQALFTVAHGQSAPFYVYARGQRITAVGTVFNVRIAGDEVRVSMLEGTVRMGAAPRGEGGAGEAAEVTLTAGEAAAAAPAAPVVVKPVVAREVASWTAGRLVFNDVRLADAVAEINRYTEQPIAIGDLSAGRYRISGVFNSNDPGRFARATTEIFPIVATRDDDGAITLRSRTQ